MLEDQVALLLQRYLGNYVRGLNKEALKISVWQGDVELTNMQLKPEALNALNLPVKVKAGFLGSVRLKVPWSKLGQEPVLVYLDRIFILAEPATQVQGCSEDAVQEAKKNRVREMETRLLESKQQLQSEMNTSWLGSLINTIIGNLKLSITNIHIRYEDLESNPGHPFAAGLTLDKLSAVTIDDSGKETFVTRGALERIQKSAVLERLAFYLDSDISPWSVDKPWEDLLPSEWSQVFEYDYKDDKCSNAHKEKHTYILQPVTGNAKYSKLRGDESKSSGQALQKAVIILDDVTLCLAQDGYRDILKLADNFSAFNQRLKNAHNRPLIPVKSNPSSWWRYAYKAVSDETKKASGKLSWDQVLRFASLRKRYISLYVSLLKSDLNRMVVDDNKEIEELDRGLDIEVILQWRMLAHKFLEQSAESDSYLAKQKTKKSWWSLGWSSEPNEAENEPWHFTDEDWKQLNKIIGYKEGNNGPLLETHEHKKDVLLTSLVIHMKHNASRLVDGVCLAELSCEGLDCSVKMYSETKVFDVKLESYQLSSPNGLLAESATIDDSLVGVFSYKPFDTQFDWSLVARASPCYMTYMKDPINQIINFFQSNAAVSQTIALETAAAVQMTIDGVKRTAQQQVTRALKDHSRFLLDLDIAAPKITIPTNFCPDGSRATKLLLDLGNLMLRTQDVCDADSPEESQLYLQFNLRLSDVSAFLVDGDYNWSQSPPVFDSSSLDHISFLPVIDRCGVILKLQQIRSENVLYPSTRLSLRLPSLGFHFSPARYHRLMQVVKIFQNVDDKDSDYIRPWHQSDFEGWLSVLAWKGVGNREAAWQRRYFSLVGPFLYLLESPKSKAYKQFLSLRGKQVYQAPKEFSGNDLHVLGVYDAGQPISKVIEDVNSVIVRFESDDFRKTWQNRVQGAIYRASGFAPISGLSESSSDSGDSESEHVDNSDLVDLGTVEKVFLSGVLDELKICFSYNYGANQDFPAVLQSEEHPLFEFRAIGGQVEFLIRGKDMFIGTLLKSLEIEDMVSCEGMTNPRYLARSFIDNTFISSASNDPMSCKDVDMLCQSSNELTQSEGEDNFFEASEDLVDPPGSASEYLSSQTSLPPDTTQPPKFIRIADLLPESEYCSRDEKTEQTNRSERTSSLDSFVKAQIVIYDQNSPHYNNLDMRVKVTLATLSFFCHRPTIPAILEFVNAINYDDDKKPSDTTMHPAKSTEELTEDQSSSTSQEPTIKGLLGKGKSRVIFYLTLNMVRAQILLMNENGKQFATLSQDNLLTDIKVFPSSFSINASLGNLKISDDSLHNTHQYFWICDMRNPGGSSFVELAFTSFSSVDEDYEGYEYELSGQFSEVRIIYLNRFVQEIVSYFMGIIPSDSKGVGKLRDQVTNSEKWFTTSEIEGSPALKLDLSLRKPIIRMPRRTDSLDYLELDVVHITVQNTFHWLRGDKNELSAVHMEILTIQVEDVNLTIGTREGPGESIIEDVKGLSINIQRSLRDLLHQIPTIEAAIKMEKLKAALSNREYLIITECAQSNIAELSNNIPALTRTHDKISDDVVVPVTSSSVVEHDAPSEEAWISMTVSVVIDLAELCLHSGVTRDAALATVQVSGAWLLYKSNTIGENFLSATLQGFTVMDDREGTLQEFRLAIGRPQRVGYARVRDYDHNRDHSNKDIAVNNILMPESTMLILDAKFSSSFTSVFLSIQRPQLLVALDFLLAVVEFFVPTVRGILSGEENENPLVIVGAVTLDQPIYFQSSSELFLSPQRPLIVDDERFDHFIYDGNGGTLNLQDKHGFDLYRPSTEAVIYVGNGKHLQFKNVIIKSGGFLDSCVMLGTNSGYSVFEYDHVILDDTISPYKLTEETQSSPTQNISAIQSSEFIIELQAIGPELTFYNTSKDGGESVTLSNKLLHAQLDAFCRVVMKGSTIELSANALGLTMESNGVRILEPFDTSMSFSNVSGKTKIHVVVSDIFMNFSFSILRLFLAVQEDILAFLRMTSKKITFVCSQFDKVGVIKDLQNKQTYTFWRPRAPPGFAILGDYLTPTDKPPTKGVLAVNTNFARVKRPTTFKQVWPVSALEMNDDSAMPDSSYDQDDSDCSIWFPVAPKGYVALGCVVSKGKMEPPSSSALCILASLVSPCALRDCITINSSNLSSSNLAFWRVDNSLGSFLPTDLANMSVIGSGYELRHIIFRYLDGSSKVSMSTQVQDDSVGNDQIHQSNRSALVNSGRRFEVVASFRLIWWNQGSNSTKKLSIWRPIVLHGMIFLGDIAVQGFEPPNSSIVLRDTQDGTLFKVPLDYKLVGQIKKQRGVEAISFWQPQSPPGFISLGCIACKGTPKKEEFMSLRCIRSDMVTGDHFSEESLWDTSDGKLKAELFSLWVVGSDGGTFLVRSGVKKPSKRFALKLANRSISSGSDDTVIDAEIRTFSAALFDDYGGLMVPLLNISVGGIGFSLHGRPNYLTSTVKFSLAARSYNDKCDSWEPLVEPMDGLLSYQYDMDAPGATSQLRVTSTRDLNLNISVSNANMIIQAYASWMNLNQVQDSYRREEATPAHDGKSVIDIHHRKNYFIIPQNKLGQDIFIQAVGVKGLQNIVRMPSGDMKSLKVPVSKNMLDAHLKGILGRRLRTMLTIIIADGQFPSVEGLSTHQYTVAVRLVPNQHIPSGSLVKTQSARTRGITTDLTQSSGLQIVTWSETFFFKVDSVDYYTVELMVTDMGNGEPVGFYSASIKDILSSLNNISDSYDSAKDLTWLQLCSPSPENPGVSSKKSQGRVRWSLILSPMPEAENEQRTSSPSERKLGIIQISPTREGPWTTVKLNYSSPSSCWRLGNDVIASEVNVKEGNRYVSMRSLVSVTNNTEIILELCLNPKDSSEDMKSLADGSKLEKIDDTSYIEELFETENYSPSIGWVGCSPQSNQDQPEDEDFFLETSNFELPSGWEWVNDWYVDNASVNTDDGWIYAPDLERIKWPESYSHLKHVNYARQRRWIRNKRQISGSLRQQILLGILKPGDTFPLPLSGLRSSYILQLRPLDPNIQNGFSWSSIVEKKLDASRPPREVCVNPLSESEELLFCTYPDRSGSSSSSTEASSRGLWFSLSIMATEIGKDIHSDSIQDWNLVVKSPLTITNFLPLSAEFSVLEMQASGHFVSCSRGIFVPGETVNICNTDLRNPLYFSLLPQGGWLPIHEAVLLSHPTKVPSKTLSLRSSSSGRLVQVILEQSQDMEQWMVAKTIRVYAPYWITIARCPPLNFKFLDIAKRKKRGFPLSIHSKTNDELVLEEINEEDIFEGSTIDSALNFKAMGLSASITHSGRGRFGPAKDLLPLCDMDGSIDLDAYDGDGNRIRLFISSKPCPYQSVPTKVITVRPFMTFTNRTGEDMYMKFSSEDEQKVLHATDSRVSFTSRKSEGIDKIQVLLEDTEWCIPIEVIKEDTFYTVLRKKYGGRRFLRTEIRGYEEGSRFLVVFRLGSANGPIRVENRTTGIISIRQSGLDDDAWVSLEPLSTTNFSWDDPYGQKLIDAQICKGNSVSCHTLRLLGTDGDSTNKRIPGMQFQVVDAGDIVIARFCEERSESYVADGKLQEFNEYEGATSEISNNKASNAAPVELIIQLGVVGISLIDHRPRELAYLYMERVFLSYSTGYDGGTTSRFKLIFGNLQLDNQLPLTVMPVLLASEQTTDMDHPVFKMTITMNNDNTDGTQVFPYVYIRVTEKSWRLSIHEPIIWALVDLHSNLQMDRIPKSSAVTQVDPEIRIDLIDVSEVRLKLSLETAPSQRPHGALGVWSPVLSAVGNAFKIQVHLRKVMHQNRFMRRSSVIPAIVNRIWRDLVHNPLHFIFSVDVLGMTSSTLASLSKGFAELSTDGQFLQLRSKQVWSRRVTGVGDGFLQGTEALAQGFAFGVSGVLTKPVESARQDGFLGLANGLGRAFLGFIVQPVSGALDFFSLTVDGIGASCSRCIEVFQSKGTYQRIRNPRAIHSDGILLEYCEREATGQMILYLAEASRHFGCTEIFKEPSKYAWSDYYQDHFIVPYQRIVLVTNKRVMLLQCQSPDKMDKKPCKIMWDVPWEDLMALELAKAGYNKPSHLILHLKNFKRSENFVRLIKCSVEEAEGGGEPQAVRICLIVRKIWKAYQADTRCVILKVPSSQRHVYFSPGEADGRGSSNQIKPMIKPREYSSVESEEMRFIRHSVNFQKIWSTEQDSQGRFILLRKQVLEGEVCSIWRPLCPDGYISVGDIARVGTHPPNVAALYHNVDKHFALPVGYDLVWRNCLDDYYSPVSLWFPRAPAGFVSLGCVAVAGFTEPQYDVTYCVRSSLAEETVFEEQKVWSAPQSYPWACHIYQVQSEALQFVGLRQKKEDSKWKPMKVIDDCQQPSHSSETI